MPTDNEKQHLDHILRGNASAPAVGVTEVLEGETGIGLFTPGSVRSVEQAGETLTNLSQRFDTARKRILDAAIKLGWTPPAGDPFDFLLTRVSLLHEVKDLTKAYKRRSDEAIALLTSIQNDEAGPAAVTEFLGRIGPKPVTLADDPEVIAELVDPPALDGMIEPKGL